VGGVSTETDDEPYRKLAASMSPEDVQLYYQIALQGRRDLAACADWRSAFEMTLLRMLAFRPGSAREPESASSGRSAGASERSAPKRSAQSGAAPAPNGTAAKRAESAAVSPPPRSATRGDNPEAWPEMLAAADVRGAARQLAEHCVIEARADGQIKLILAADKAHLNTDQVRNRLESSLAAYLGSRLRLTITPGKPSVPTPAEQRKANETRRMRQAREAIESDPLVKGFQSAFDAVVDADTIEPVEPAKGTMQ